MIDRKAEIEKAAKAMLPLVNEHMDEEIRNAWLNDLATAAIEPLLDRLERYEVALVRLIEASEPRRVEGFDPSSRVTVIETRTKDIVDFHEALDEARAAIGIDRSIDQDRDLG